MSRSTQQKPGPDVVTTTPKPPTPDEMRRLLVACWGEDGLRSVAIVHQQARARGVDPVKLVAQKACVPIVYAEGWVAQAKAQGIIEDPAKKSR